MKETEINEQKAILESVGIYLNHSIRHHYYQEYLRKVHNPLSGLSEQHEAIESPFHIDWDEEILKSRKILWRSGEKALLLPEKEHEAISYLKNIYAPKAFIIFKMAFQGKYGGWDVPGVIETEVENIERFINYSKGYPIDKAFETKRVNPVSSYSLKVDYQCSDTSCCAEYVRLNNGFYNQHYFEGDEFSSASLVYALSELFLPYLRSNLNNDQTPAPASQNGMTSNEPEKHNYPSFKPESVPQIFDILKSHFQKEQHEQLRWVLETGGYLAEPLTYLLPANGLCDFFKQLLSGQFISIPIQVDLEKWISKNFRYLSGRDSKEIPTKYVARFVSGTGRPAKGKRLIEIREENGKNIIVQLKIVSRQKSDK